jgi:hypothetical protein
MSNRIFTNTEPISSAIAPKIQNEIINKILSYYPDLGILPIGSIGKKKDDDFNGDIDIAILCENTNELIWMIENVFPDIENYTIESLYIVSIKYPYEYKGIQKYVQCDFMVMWDKDYTSFRYYCPDYRNNESKYKVGVKIMFANMVLNHCQEKNKNLSEGYIGKFDFRPTALYRYVFDIKNSLYKEEYISNSPKEIAGIAFKDSDPKHFNSVETIWNDIHTSNFKYPDEVKQIEKNFFVNCFRKGWTNIIPEDFLLVYWDNETLYKYINEQKFINEINSLQYKSDVV